MNQQMILLPNGLEIPSICYGLGMLEQNLSQYEAYSSMTQIRESYKELSRIHTLKRIFNTSNKIFIDTSSAYGLAENVIGKQISKIERDKIVICTKISARDQLRHGNRIDKICKNSMTKLNVNELDIYLMHWPVDKNFIDVWKQMQELYYEKKVKAIGVCNCHIHHLDKILSQCTIKPMLHQMEIHPLFTQSEVSSFCRSEGIQIMAYTPLARNDDRLINSRLLKKLSLKYKKSISQVILRWHVQLGNIPVVSTGNYKHYCDNMNIFDFSLSEEEVNRISKMNINSRLRYDSDNCDFLEL